jgi:hypothetical protein
MYRLNPPLIFPAFYHPRFSKSSCLSFYGYNMCFVKLLLRCQLVYWDVWKLVIVRLSSLGLMHIHRDFEVDLYKEMEVFVSAKTW